MDGCHHTFLGRVEQYGHTVGCGHTDAEFFFGGDERVDVLQECFAFFKG